MRKELPLEQRMEQFKEMLVEKEISAYSTWEKELQKIGRLLCFFKPVFTENSFLAKLSCRRLKLKFKERKYFICPNLHLRHIRLYVIYQKSKLQENKHFFNVFN